MTEGVKIFLVLVSGAFNIMALSTNSVLIVSERQPAAVSTLYYIPTDFAKHSSTQK